MTRPSVGMDGLRVAVWFQGAPWPVRSGVQARVADVIDGLRDNGAQVQIFSTAREASAPWSDEAFAEANAHGMSGIELAPARSLPERFVAKSLSVLSMDTLLYRWSFPSTNRWMRERLGRWNPDVLWFNHVTSAGLHRAVTPGRRRTILEMHDLLGANLRMRRHLEWFSRAGMLIEPCSVPDRLIDPTCFDGITGLGEREERALGSFGEVVCISPLERDLLQEKRVGRLHYMPATSSAGHIHEGTGNPLFPTGPNHFNLQGYSWFVKRVLPRILHACPEFELDVSGSACDRFRQNPGVRHVGVVRDFDALLARSSFCVIPVWGGTGQQLKIVQAMAAGKAVVTCRQRNRFDPVIVDGIADCGDEERFAQACIELWNDLERRRSMGRKAYDAHLFARAAYAPRQVLQAIMGSAS